MSSRNTGLMIGEAVWQALEIGEAHTVSPDDVIPVGEQRMGEMGFGGQPGIGE